MERMPSDPYEQKLFEVFESCCDARGKGNSGLDTDGLSRLCDILHLEEGKEQLMSYLFSNGSSSGDVTVSFMKFKDALLTLLGGVRDPDSLREPSPVREVSPKYIYGQKKYGRRSRPESKELDSDSIDLIINDSSTDFSTPSCEVEFDCNELLNVKPSNLQPTSESNHKDFPDLSDLSRDEVQGEADLRRALQTLGVGKDGFLNRTELSMVCSSIGMDAIADEVLSQAFCKLDPDGEGRISFEDFLLLFKCHGSSYSTPNQRFSKSPVLDSWENVGNNSNRIMQELQSLRFQLESVTEERDKLKLDLNDANHRATILAQEIDEHHSRIEKSSKNKIKLLEQKHVEEMNDVIKQSSAEKEQLLTSIKKLEKDVLDHVELQGRLVHEISVLRKDYEQLEVESKGLNVKLNESERSKLEMQKELDCLETLQQRVLELEASNDEISSLKMRINQLQLENNDLRDKNDELTLQLESLTLSKISQKSRDEQWSLMECDCSESSHNKRKDKSLDCWPDADLGKVKRCCTEMDLSSKVFVDGCHNRLGKCVNGFEDYVDSERPSLFPISASLDNMASLSVSNASDIISSDAEWEDSRERKINIGVQTSEDLEQLERQCAELRSTLDRVRVEIVRILTEKKECSEENCALRLRVTELMTTDNTSPEKWMFEDIAELSQFPTGGSPKKEPSFPYDMEAFKRGMDYFKICAEGSKYSSLSSQMCSEAVNPPSEAEPNSEEPSSERTNSLADEDCYHANTSKPECLADTDLNCDKSACDQCILLVKKNKQLLERCEELENSLDELRIEYEKTEDYWEKKLDEERKQFELDQYQTDEKFAELEAKIQEYAELFGMDCKKPTLPTIEEKDYLEKQFTDLEEEFEAYKLNAEKEKMELEEVVLNLKSENSRETKDAETQTRPSHLSKPLKKTRSTPGYSTQIAGSSRIVGGDLQVFHNLTSRLKSQEIKCRELQTALKQQQKQSEQVLQKAWERHKSDLCNIQSSLRQTQDKLDHQMKTTKQHLDKLALADGLLKDLYAENAQLVSTVVHLEQKFLSQSESALHNSL